MDNEPADEAAETRSDLATWLDDYAAGRCDRARMQASFLDICRSNPEAPWDALALLDQYQRRGRVDAGLARSLKSDIAQLVFGVVDQTEDEEDEDDESAVEAREARKEPEPAVPANDTTGTRWRKLVEERKEPAGARRQNTFADPMQFSRDVEPLTRPPPPQPKARQAHSTDGTAPGSILRERYELLTILGRGANGTVYKALDRHRAHLDPSSRCVALRVLKLNYRDSPHALAELEQQFHQAQSLAHPNILSVHDLDRDGGTFFMVMELLEGELLADVVDRLDHRPMAKDRALAIVGGVGAALAHAHRRGLVHGDLKPGNVMLGPNGDVKVTDFGFVRRHHVDPKRSEPWVGDPAIAGAPPSSTFAYASEERVNAETPQPGDDVYSLACIAYELLSGHHPYGGRSAPLARAQGRRPQRIKALNHRQWSALQTALQWSKADRQIDVIGLIAGLGCADVTQRFVAPAQIVAVDSEPRRWTPVGSVLVTLLLLGAAAFAYWRGYFQLPSIDEGSLPIATVTDPTPESAPPQVAPEAAATPDVQTVPTQRVEAPTIAAAAPALAPQTPAAPPQSQAAASTSSPVTPSRIAFDKDTYVATESDGSVRLVVRRTGNLRSAATLQWALLPNSAVAGDDFAGIGPGVERFKPGSQTVTLTIPLVSDAIKEATELFLVELRPVDNSSELGDLARAAVLVVDDD